MITPKCHYSLRARIGKIVLVFSILLVSFYTTMLAMLYEWGLADATHGIVWQEAHLFQEAYKKDKNTPLPNTQTLKGYIGEKNLPENIVSIFPRHKLKKFGPQEEGLLYRFEKKTGLESHHHLLVANLYSTPERFFIYYNITVSDEVADKVWHKFKLLAIAGGVLVIMMLLVFKTTIARSLKPISSLSQWIDNLDQSSPPGRLPSNLKSDEIGQMAESLYNALQRIHQYNERERQFLRNASHELRTPIAIIRNALDVLEHKRKVGNDNIDNLVQRIRRAGDTMKSVTEAILWLAIENYSAPNKQSTDLKALVTEIIDENKNLNDGRQIKISLDIDLLENCEIEKALAYIVLDNLIRNAFQHCCDGEIKIVAQSASQIQIINTSHSYSYDSPKAQDAAEALVTGSFGLGLTLVKKIADKQGWVFDFELDEHQASARFGV
ncbi:Signal transduction histidine kinase [Alteromonadaceae bacterium Bs31]|nr:Signal transduction histidine kinase [Alteromonadaceae bacterium Bs31]